MCKPFVPRLPGRAVALLAALALCLGSLACEKLDQPAPMPQMRGDSRVTMPFKDAISLDYGNLVAVTPHPTNPPWAGLWFQREDKTITVVWANIVDGRIHDDVLRFPRR